MPLILCANGKGIGIWIDASHAVHADMKGHVGTYASMGKGAVISSASKAKLNTGSSTETEVVAVGEKICKFVWFRYLREHQTGYANEDILYQDNKSSMLLENNGIFSARKESKHIHIRYYLITDRVKKKEFKIMYCPTEEMIADFFTKPLQGAQFVKFRDAVLGIDAKNDAEYLASYQAVLKKFGLVEEENAEA